MDDKPKTFANLFAYWTVKDTNAKNNNNNNNNNSNKVVVKKLNTNIKSNNEKNVDITQQQPVTVNNQPQSTSNNNPTTTTTTNLTSNQNNNIKQNDKEEILHNGNILNNNTENNNNNVNTENNNNINNNTSFINNSYQTNLRGYQPIVDNKFSGHVGYVNSAENYPISAYTIMPMSSDNESESGNTRSLTSSSSSGYDNVDQANKAVSYSTYSAYSQITSNSSNLSPFINYSSVSESSNYNSGGSSTYSTFYLAGESEIDDEDLHDDLDDSNDYTYDNNDINNNNAIKEKREREKSLLKSREAKDSGRDWNKEFQSLLRMQPSLDKFQKLNGLAMDFVKAAENYGRIIIKEMFMPAHTKTIQPIDIGGIAGGQKFISQNILFKFAYDQKVGSGPGSWLYGGKVPSDFGASKAAGNELRGLSLFFQHLIDNDFADRINVPLMCIIDYYGYRLVAISLLPINKQTLIYGSCDGGNTVHDDIKEVNDMMEKVAKGMNLKGHLAGINPTYVYGPGDFEIHRSANNSNEYYALDFARLLPPQAHFDSNQNAIPHREVFFKLLRPEFLRTFEKPLNSDAFTGWSSNDPEQELHNQDVADATKHLYDVVIKQAATELELLREDDAGNIDVTVEVHKFGINLRHLGKLRNQIDTSKRQLRKSILNEMVARVLKNEIKDEQRIHLRGHFIGSEEKCIEVIVNFLNNVFNVNRFSNEKSFWTITIKSLLLDKYGTDCGLTADEIDSKFDLSHSISISDVISRFQTKTGIKLSSRIKTILQGHNVANSLPMILYTDIKAVRPVIKHSNMIARSEGISLYMKALEFIYSNTVYYGKPTQEPDYTRFGKVFAEEHSLLDSCRQKLELASRSSTTDASLHHLLGLVDIEKLKLNWFAPPNDYQTSNFQLAKRAEKTLISSLSYNDTPGAIISLATIYDILPNIEKAHSTYKRLASFDHSITVPILYESASLYAPYFSPPKHLSFLAISAHQFCILIEILESLASDHPLVTRYLHNCYKIFSVILLRCISIKNLEAIRILESIYSINYSEKFESGEFNLCKQFAPVMERVIKYDRHILDDIIFGSKKCTYGSVPFISYLQYVPFVPSLASIMKETLSSNPLSSFDYNHLDSLFSNQIAVESLLALGSQLDLVIYRRVSSDIFTQLLQFQTNLSTLVIENIYVKDDQSFLDLFSCIKPTLKQLKMTSVRFNGTNPLLGELPVCSELRDVTLKELEFEPATFRSLFAVFVGSVETLSLERIAIEEFPEVLQSITKLKRLDLNTVNYLNINYIPSTIDTFGCYSEFYEHPEDQPFVETLMRQCPSITNLQVQNYQHKIYNELSSLKKYPFTKLRLSLNNQIMAEQNMHEDLQVWSSSLKHLVLQVNSYGEFNHIDTVLSSFHSLVTLDLGYNKTTDEHLSLIAEHSPLLESLIVDGGQIKMEAIPTKPFVNLSTLRLNCLRSPTNNFINLGFFFPSLKSLSINNPGPTFNDTGFRKLLENVQSLEEFMLSACFDLTDSSIIALCCSSNVNTLKVVSIIGMIDISDSSFVKIAESCKKLSTLEKQSLFKRFTTEQYFGARYPLLADGFYVAPWSS